MSTRAERAARVSVAGEMDGVRFAEHIGIAHGTVKRWLHEGMPARRDQHKVWITPADAQTWIDARYRGRKPIGIGRRSYIYVAHRHDDGAVKIGWTSDVMRRIAELRKEGRAAIELVACLPGDKPDELRLHGTFEARRIDGEWFMVPVDEVLAALRGAA